MTRYVITNKAWKIKKLLFSLLRHDCPLINFVTAALSDMKCTKETKDLSNFPSIFSSR